ncbi:RNA-directed DNA polymerase from mobile element jockey [Trichonephila clavipes]|uniref:RNA-directed DNA polymerase from mobile element jockey n=1 Tax=Trichonephila clavipes TaxID=2585209 RepID=A0A8X6VKD8_TRICX|nr:RNA-directed DNA polymerase from mobile element jockey [Trichonephila clavipes]
MWSCPNNSIRGCQLKTFVDTLDLSIAFPDTPTRYGYRSANTLDFAIINNFHFPYNINSLAELSSDHNPVILNFSLLPQFIMTTLGQLPPAGQPLKIT